MKGLTSTKPQSGSLANIAESEFYCLPNWLMTSVRTQNSNQWSEPWLRAPSEYLFAQPSQLCRARPCIVYLGKIISGGGPRSKKKLEKSENEITFSISGLETLTNNCKVLILKLFERFCRLTFNVVWTGRKDIEDTFGLKHGDKFENLLSRR